MDSIKKYEYIMEPPEIREFCCKVLIEQIKYGKKRGLILAWIVLLVEVLIIPRIVWAMLLLLVVMTLSVNIRNYIFIKKQVEDCIWTVWMEDGRLKVNRGDYSEVPCRNIQLIRTTRRLLMLGYMQTPQKPAWFVIPLRLFGDEQEREMFLGNLRSAQAQPSGEPAHVPGYTEGIYGWEDRAVQEGLQFAYFMDEEKGLRFYKGAADLVYGGTFGKKERLRASILWGCLAAVVMTVCMSILTGGINRMAVGFGLSITAMMILRIWTHDPEKSLRKQMKSPVMRDKINGLWQILLSKEGISVCMPMGVKNFYSWESLEWLVETGEVFYIFHRDKRHYIMIAKESFQSWDQVSAFHQLCAERGIKRIPAKKAGYIPDWAWMPLAVLFMFACVGVFVAGTFFSSRKGSGSGRTVYDGESVDPAWYPNYVPLDQQVRVLESLGMYVPEETVESVRGFMEEYDMYELVEGSPYTSLLMNIGAPEHDEDWNLVGYSDQVFWFDFEGLDISTDYIDVLNGMAALAEGSSIDKVSDISENTDDVNWERGKGKITVSLTWDGQTYEWDMDVYYDWIDDKVLGIYNTLLEKDDSQKLFYSTWDNGQGAIVFFCTPEWAEEFMQKTGLELERDKSRSTRRKQAVK